MRMVGRGPISHNSRDIAVGVRLESRAALRWKIGKTKVETEEYRKETCSPVRIHASTHKLGHANTSIVALSLLSVSEKDVRLCHAFRSG